MSDRIEVVLGDITKVKYDAIVNAANKSLLSGGGVDGAIHKAAGSMLEDECRTLGGCPVGEAKITRSYDLERNSIGWVIHAVGPRWLGGLKEEEKLLERAYLNSLKLAVNYKEAYLNQCMNILNRYTEGFEENKKGQLSRELKEDMEAYAKKHPIKNIAFPSISTGIYRFPLEAASRIAVSTINKFLNEHEEIEKVAVVCFDKITYEHYANQII